MLTNYKQNCEELMKGRLESVTRYKFENLKLENYKEFVVECNIEVINSMSVTYTERRVAGGGKSGELHYNSSEYKQSIRNHCDREYNDENFALLVSNIQSGGYAKYANKSTFKYGSTILCEYRCGKCNGKGEYKCDKCMGKGELRCSSCQGKGETRCDECGGKGEYRCGKCSGSGTIVWGAEKNHIDRCSKCNGSGTLDCYSCNKTGWKRCYSCSGSGYVTCSRCRGKTILICDSCDGSGSVTDMADICVQTTPKYNITFLKDTSEQVKSIIQSNMVENIKNIANVARVVIRQDDSSKKVIENYKIQVPFATFHLTFNDKQFEYTIYGKNLQIEKWHDDIVPTILANDVKILAKLAKESSFFSTKILAKSQVAVANFMESQVNKDIIEADSQLNNERYSKIDDRVREIQNSLKSKVVSDDYIKWAIQSLHKIASRFCLAVRLKYISIAFAISFIFMFCSGYGMFIKEIIVLVIFVCVTIIIKYKEEANIKKFWGEDLTAWIDRRDIFVIKTYRENNKDKYKFNEQFFGGIFLSSLIAVFVAVGLMNHYVISFDEIKSKITNLTQSTKSTQTKQPTQNKQTQKQTQSAQNMPQCNNSALLNHLIKADREDIAQYMNSQPDYWNTAQELGKEKGLNFANIDDYVKSLKYDIISVKTQSIDEANRKVICKAEVIGIDPLLPDRPSKLSWNYIVQLNNDNSISWGWAQSDNP